MPYSGIAVYVNLALSASILLLLFFLVLNKRRRLVPLERQTRCWLVTSDGKMMLLKMHDTRVDQATQFSGLFIRCSRMPAILVSSAAGEAVPFTMKQDSSGIYINFVQAMDSRRSPLIISIGGHTQHWVRFRG